MRVALHADPALRWTFPVLLSGLVDAVVLRTDMLNLSNDKNGSRLRGTVAFQLPLLKVVAIVLPFSQQSPFVRFQRYNS